MYSINYQLDNKEIGSNDLFPEKEIGENLNPGNEIARFLRIISEAAGDQILTQGRHLGEEYQKLSDDYEVFKIKNYPDQPYILIREEDPKDNLFNAVTLIDKMKPLINNDLDDITIVTVTFDNDYLVFHDSDDPRTIMPHRPVLGFNDQDADKVRNLFVEALERAGL